MRINQYLAFHLGLSRRGAEEPVLKGQVKLNGKVVTELFTQVTDDDQVEVFRFGKWEPISKTQNQTILVYKTPFIVTTHSDPEGRRTVYDLLPKKYGHLKSAGRLDFMSEGLLVLSTDGQLIQELTHPSRNHDKIYLVGLSRPLSEKAIFEMQSGELQLEENILAPMKVESLSATEMQEWSFLKISPNLIWYKFTLSEGRNNQIRKVCQLFGNGVTRLIRVKQGQFFLNRELMERKWLEVSAAKE